MLDLLFNPKRAERHPLEMILIGIFYSSLSVFMGLWIFNVQSSMAIVFLTVFSCIYVVQGALRLEEQKDKNYEEEAWVLKEHKKVAIMLLALFIGFMISFLFWSYTLPVETGERVFELQKISVDHIRSITGNAVNLSGPLFEIFSNNVKIVFISIIFALLYGAGAIYVLVWNASVMGYFIGALARESTSIFALPLAIIRFSIHGIPEMLAYVVAALAGGILYFALIRGDLVKKDRVKRLVIDVLTLVSISIVLLVISALLEVYISPIFRLQ